MKLISQGIKFEIEDRYIEYSPLLYRIMKTDIPIEMDGEYIRMDEICNPASLREYLNFLQGRYFNMNGEVSMAFDLMGHENKLNFDHATWKVKLYDNWIRDNFYRLKLYKNPRYGLVLVPIKNRFSFRIWKNDQLTYIDIKDMIAKGGVIAGGAALWMTGYTDSFSDIDIFFACSKEIAELIIYDVYTLKFNRHLLPNINNNHVRGIGGVSIGEHTVSILLNLQLFDECNQDMGTKLGLKVLFILRTYTCISEIVHGFDLDCVGFIYDPNTDKLYGTRRALHSVDRMTNWFDPARSSPSYDWRLIKYKGRGFNISLPHLDESNIDDKVVHDIFRKIAKTIASPTSEYRDTIDAEYWLNNGNIDKHSISNATNHNEVKDEILELVRQLTGLLSTSEMHSKLDEEIENILNSCIIHRLTNKYIINILSKYITLDSDNKEYLRRFSFVTEITKPVTMGSLFMRFMCRASKNSYDYMNMKDLIPSDPVSRLILSQFYNFWTSLWAKSDYESNKHKRYLALRYIDILPEGYEFDEILNYHGIENVFLIRSSQWIEQNPMLLVSSTIYPTPILDLKSWYETSPLYK